MSKPIRSIKNQYLGINAHLHSHWQSTTGWKGFHTVHIGDLTKHLKQDLLPRGYTAGVEDSLQIRRSEIKEVRPTSDIAIYDLDLLQAYSKPEYPVKEAVLEAAPVSTLTMHEIMVDYEELSEYQAITISKVQEDRDGTVLVAWIELLSSSNKLKDLTTYRNKRHDLLTSGVVFVELDYLHQSPPTVSSIPNYARGRGKQGWVKDAHAYRILVIDPRPEMSKGKAYVYQFDVDAPIPVVTIPLSGSDSLAFDFGLPYHKTLAETFFAYELVDYSEFPENFDRYSPEDRQRIAERIATVLEAAIAKTNLETGPFPRKSLAAVDWYKHIGELRQQLGLPPLFERTELPTS